MVRIFLISLILIACLPVGIKAQSIKKQFQYLHALIGSWESINDKPGQRTVETWSLKSQGLLKGNINNSQQMRDQFIELGSPETEGTAE